MGDLSLVDLSAEREPYDLGQDIHYEIGMAMSEKRATVSDGDYGDVDEAWDGDYR
ncbi:hypothetical protein [Streptomyces phaeochromogenes]|uniref:hypothetical protein n=1 Tax=Streptomyces phaeochromogenes TaxID=1923 RepID=UPI0036C27889